MKKHYYFVKGLIKYTHQGNRVEEPKQVSYELTQEDGVADREFFLSVEGEVGRLLKKSFLVSRPYIEETQIASVTVDSICKLN